MRLIRAIDGWFWPAAAYLFALLDEIQKDRGIRGDIFEIGAYHGKSAAFLAAMLDPATERLGVCDLFGAAPDGSNGRGFRSTFEANIRALFPDPHFLKVHGKDAAELGVSDTSDRCRIFHIDGGHDANDVFHDLVTASAAVHPEGVVVLDDFHNFAWPGVAEGFFRFMRDRPGEFVPLAVGFNKGVLTRPAARSLYEPAFRHPERSWRVIPRGPYSLKTIELCGVETFVFFTPSYRSPDLRRTVLSALHQHRPRFADALVRFIGYHGDDGLTS